MYKTKNERLDEISRDVEYAKRTENFYFLADAVDALIEFLRDEADEA